MIWLILFIIAFLAGTFAYSYRLLKKQSKNEEKIDPAKLRKWEDDD
ncbi:MAG: hypothetical protein ACSHXK_08360 [Oceanococcus sp.]